MHTFIFRSATALACCLLLIACSPKFDWREVPGSAAPYAVMLPAKPATHARDINLDGRRVTMTMTGAEVDGVTFAVGSVPLDDPGQGGHALRAMKTGLVRNIEGTIIEEKVSVPAEGTTMMELEAAGPLPQGRRLLLARLIAHGNHAFQLLVVGDESKLSREAADTFFTSFRLP